MCKEERWKHGLTENDRRGTGGGLDWGSEGWTVVMDAREG